MKQLFRYQRAVQMEEEFEPNLKLLTFDISRETPKGFWIDDRTNYELQVRWVPGYTVRRYAYPTKKEALNNFKERTKRCLFLQECAADNSRQYLNFIKDLIKNEAEL